MSNCLCLLILPVPKRTLHALLPVAKSLPMACIGPISMGLILSVDESNACGPLIVWLATVRCFGTEDRTPPPGHPPSTATEGVYPSIKFHGGYAIKPTIRCRRQPVLGTVCGARLLVMHASPLLVCSYVVFEDVKVSCAFAVQPKTSRS